MNNSKLSTKESIYIILSVIIANSILSLPKNLISNMKSGIITNLIFVFLILLSLCLIIVKLFKKFPGMDILDISEFLGGTIFKKILGILFIAYFITSSSILLREFCEAIEVVYYPKTDIVFVIMLFIIAIAITSRLEFSSTIKTNLLIVPIVLVSIVFLFFSNMKNFNNSSLFPLLGNGFYETFILGIGNIYAFSGIVLLYFLPPLLKKPENFKKITIISLILFILYIILTVLILLFTFSFFVSEDEILPLYAAARYIEIGHFFVRLESLFLLIWIAAFACFMSIYTRFSMLCFKKITKIKDTKILAFPFSILIFSVSMIPDTYANVIDFEKNIFPYITILFSFIFCISLLIYANIKKYKERKIIDHEY